MYTQPHHKVREWCTRDGAIRLAAIIQAYWAEQGFEVDAKVEKADTEVNGVYIVRSNMLNGLPPWQRPHFGKAI